jgi:hypothetical protein
MNMSKAALPPRNPVVTDQHRAHPLYALYRQHLASCRINLIEASQFDNWLYQYEIQIENDKAAADPQYPAFMRWMRENQGGARRCPVGVFPHNFRFWCGGGRW